MMVSFQKVFVVIVVMIVLIILLIVGILFWPKLNNPVLALSHPVLKISLKSPTDREVSEEIVRQKELVNLMRASVPRDEMFDDLNVVIDIGHGEGNDPGALRILKTVDKQEVTHAESNLTLDIARRLGWYFRHRGANGIYYTLGPSNIVDPTTEDEYSYYHPLRPPLMIQRLNTLLLPNRFARTNLEAVLSTRTEVANQKLKTYGSRIIFLSIHVDSVAANTRGMRIYRYYGQKSELSLYLLKAATAADVARRIIKGKEVKITFPQMQAAFIVIDPRFNNVKEKLLIETANIRNDQDLFELLLPAYGREKLAHTIGSGTAEFYRATAKK